jgi:hypothetical protein
MTPLSSDLAGAVSLAAAGEFHCGERLITDEDALCMSIARRVTFKRLPAFNRLAAAIRLESLNLFVFLEAGIVIFPPGPGAARSSSASNSSELLTLITLSAFFPLVTLPPVLTLTDEAGPNGGALVNGCGSFAPAPAKVPVVDLLPPKPV